MNKLIEAAKQAEHVLELAGLFGAARELRQATAQAGTRIVVACTVRGFSLWLDRESWGHIIDGLILERERSEQRKSNNPESNSNITANKCAELITQINAAAAGLSMAPVEAEQPCSDFETWWQQEGQETLYALNTLTDADAKVLAEIAWKNGAYKAEQQGPVVEALQIATVALQYIACSSQTENLLWWQARAREAQKQIAECLTGTAPPQPKAEQEGPVMGKDIRYGWQVGQCTSSMTIGAQLATRDGRRLGNAVVVNIREVTYPSQNVTLTVATIVTDAGSVIEFTENELNECFYPATCVMDVMTHPGFERLSQEDRSKVLGRVNEIH